MNINSEAMSTAFDHLLMPEEKCLCKIYCVFKEGGFFANSLSTAYGYAACASFGRLLTVRNHIYMLGEQTGGVFILDTALKLKVRRLIIGQYVVEGVFPYGKRKYNLNFQFSPKMAGSSFPDQQRNAEIMLSELQRYATSK